MARPRKDIDKKIFENLCGLQCTPSEILQNVEKQLQEQNVLLKKILERLRE